MTTNRDQFEGPEEKRLHDKGLERIRLFGALPKGYEPDENDPAWPSKSGQAD